MCFSITLLTLAILEIIMLITSYAVLFGLIDFIYLSFFAYHFKKIIQSFDYYSLLIYYIFSIVYLYFVFVDDNLTHNNEKETYIKSAIFGLILYTTFSLISKCIFKNLTWKTLLFNILWGPILFLIVTFISKNSIYFKI